MVSSNNKFLLIDGNNLFHRAYHAIPPLTSKDGEMVNAVFGFSNMFIKALNEVRPDYVACAFDTAAPTFRHIEFEKYKAQRPAPPTDLYPQLPIVKKVLDAFGIKYFEKEGYEADDLLATIVSKAIEEPPRRQATRKHLDCIILSGDRDVLQLVDGDIKVQAPGWNLKETTLYGTREVREKYGLEPYQMVDYKSLTGDPSDNVPGIAGIGPKTAAQLLQKYHTLENLFKHLAELAEPLRAKLAEGKDTALAAKRLVELDRDVDIGFELGKLEFKPDWNRARQAFEELGFRSIVSKLPGGSTKETESQSVKVKESKSKKNGNKGQLKLV